ncbi:MAG: DUF433 domain-containing protein [Dehalococcoidia bacterium]
MATLTPPAPSYADIGTLVTCTPGVQGGQPCVAGTRMPVRMLVWRVEGEGLSPEAVADDYAGITTRDVYAALAFYYANRERLDQEWAEDDEDAGRMEAEYKAARAVGLLPDW